MFRRDRFTLPLLVLLTLIAGILRFVSLDRPSIWGDEAMTYGRVCGTYQELLDQLADSAFTPLHYVTEWWVGQGLPYWGTLAPQPDTGGSKSVFTPTRRIVVGGIRLTPQALRFIPALAGTLMVPALFWLARQLFGPRVALTAACLACFSAYALVYSRDAKMYMHFWLAVTLHVSCTLWWVRTRRPVAWALWVLFGAIMIGLHATGFYVLAVDALIVFTSPRQHWLRLAGLIAWPIVVLPYYVYERRRRDRLDGLRVLHGREPTSTRWWRFLLWPRRGWRRRRWPVALGFTLGALLMAAGPVGYYQSFSRKYQRLADANAPQVDTGELGIDWVDRYNADRGLGGHVLYTVSAYLTGWEWPRHYPELKADPAAMSARPYTEIRVPLDDQKNVNPRTLVLLQEATILLLVLLAVGLVPWRRLFSPVRTRLDRVRQESRVALPFRRRRAMWLTVWGLALPWAVYTQSFSRPANPLDAAANVLLKAPPDVTWPRARRVPEPRRPDPGVVEAVRQEMDVARQYGADISAGWPAAWAKYSAAYGWDNLNVIGLAVAGGLATACVIVISAWPRRVGVGAWRLAQAAIVALVIGTLLTLVPRFVDANVWMPRYLGAAWPALAVGAAVLIDRQPRGLRWATLLLFVVTNTAQYSARVWGGSEPPVGLIAADVLAGQPKSKVMPSQPERPSFRAYIGVPMGSTVEPGGGTLFTAPGRYYMHLFSEVPGPAAAVRLGWIGSNLVLRSVSRPEQVSGEMKRSPEINRFVIWSTFTPGSNERNDAVADQLQGLFRRVNEETWPARDHWRWVERFTVRRRTYERIGPSK